MVVSKNCLIRGVRLNFSYWRTILSSILIEFRQVNTRAAQNMGDINTRRDLIYTALHSMGDVIFIILHARIQLENEVDGIDRHRSKLLPIVR